MLFEHGPRDMAERLAVADESSGSGGYRPELLERVVLYLAHGMVMIAALSASTFAIYGLIDPELASAFRSELTPLLFSPILLIGGSGFMIQTIRGHRRRYVWCGVSTTLRRADDAALYSTMLTTHCLSSLAMVLVGFMQEWLQLISGPDSQRIYAGDGSPLSYRPSV